MKTTKEQCWFVGDVLIHIGEWDYCEDGGVIYAPLPDGATSEYRDVINHADGSRTLA